MQSQPHDSTDWYEILEVSPKASQAVIHAAYRALARASHPDHNASPEAARRIRQLNAAFRVLGDLDHRARYDLDLARARRHARTARPAHRISTIEVPARVQALPTRVPAQSRPTEDGFTLPSAHIWLALVLVAALATIVLVLVLMSLGAVGDDPASAGTVAGVFSSGWNAR
jgi:hypothetical protein